jgi:hypothetical protein
MMAIDTQDSRGLVMFGKISACLMAILLSASGIIGQSMFGSIVGVVKDPGEGTIADAQITFTNLDDHVQQNATSFSAKVGDSGKILTSDKDNRIWMVSNPETLSGIDGRHVKVEALVDVSRSQIRVVSVSAIADEQSGIRLDDAAFRR